MSGKQDGANQQAFQRGQEAWREGKPLGANPYPDQAPYHDHWAQGWQAEADIQTK